MKKQQNAIRQSKQKLIFSMKNDIVSMTIEETSLTVYITGYYKLGCRKLRKLNKI